MKAELTQERLKELLHYDPETGHFTWRVTRNPRTAPFDSRAGSPNRKGYILIRIDGIRRLAHRLAFLYMTGGASPEFVDHINRVKDDNSWGNLRPATSRDNQGNVGVRSDNTSGHRGVTWHKRLGKWQAYGARDGRRIYLGYYTSLEEAAAVAQKWREEYFGIFAATA
jgi:hypothetical protein